MLTLTMYLQDTLSRFHRPECINRPSCPRGECVDSHPCVSQIPEPLSSPYTAQSSQKSICTICSIGLLLRYPRMLYQPAPSPRIHQNQTDHVLFLGRRIRGIPRLLKKKPLTQTAIPQLLRRSLTSSPIIIGHHHDRTLRNARNTRNIKIAANDHVACKISNQISEQTLDVDFITSSSSADVSGQLTNSILDVKTIQPE